MGARRQSFGKMAQSLALFRQHIQKTFSDAEIEDEYKGW